MKIVGQVSLAAVIVVGLAASGCSDGTPTESSGTAQAQFEVGSSRVETFSPTTVDVAVTEKGSPMMMESGQMQVEHMGGGGDRTFEMEPMGDGFTGQMMFFEPGEYELHFEGRMGMGGMMEDLGHHQIMVHRQHRVVGPYWVELEVEPAPVIQNSTARVRFLVFENAGDAAGDPVSGLTARVTIHDPDGSGPTLVLDEVAAGSYETEHAFGGTGLSELHLELDVGGAIETGNFHMPVLATVDDHGLDYRDHHGGTGHGMGM